MGNDTSSQRNGKNQHKEKGGASTQNGVINTVNESQQPAQQIVEAEKRRMDTVPLEKDEDMTEKRDEVEPAAAPPKKKQPPVPTVESADTFAGKQPTRRQLNEEKRVMVTDGPSDVRVRYHINPREVGHGHYGVVRKCMDRESGEWYAIKSIRKAKVSRIDVLKREIAILKEVSHPHIIKLIEVAEDEKYLHLITELCTGGELFDRIIAKTNSPEGHFSEKDAVEIVWCILDAIAYCHDVKHIVHRDLKPENFLFLTKEEKSPIKIIDFGLSRHDDNAFGGIMKTKVGTPYYVAPEVLERRYAKSCDIWSIGVITYILLCGYPPFYGDSDTQIFNSVRTGRFDFPSPDWDDISDDAKNFIRCLLKLNPEERLTASQALKHRWIVKQGGHADNKVLFQSIRSSTFKKFMGMKKLKKAALAYIANNLTKAEVGELEKVFNEIDADKNGLITLAELDNALDHCNFPSNMQNELRRLREELCLSDSEGLDWKHFIAATMDKNIALREDKIHMAFNHFKSSGQNCLSLSDLVEMFGGEEQAREIMGDVDLDGDGRISYEDFKGMMAESFLDGDVS